MRQAVAALLGAGVTVAACYCAGALMIQRLKVKLGALERASLAFVLGASILHLAVFATLTLQIGYWPVWLALLLVAIAGAAYTGAWRLPQDTISLTTRLRLLIALCTGPFLAVYFFNAWAPESSPDGSTYHLGLVARYVNHHGFEHITSSIYAMLPAGVDLIFVPAFAIGRHSAASLVHLSLGIAMAIAMFAYGQRIGNPWMGVLGALLTFLSPTVGRTASSAYNDVGAAAIVFSVFYWLELWDTSQDFRLLIPAGLLSGYAYAAKPTALAIGVYAVCFVLWRVGLRRSIRPLVAVVSCAFVMAGPWIVRNWILYHNPLAPLGNTVFRNPYVHVSFEHYYRWMMSLASRPDIRRVPFDVTTRGELTHGVIGPIFLLVPIAILALRHPAGRHLLAAGLCVISTCYFASIDSRFLIPSLPFLSLGIALALSRWPALLAATALTHAVLSWPFMVPLYSGPGVWKLDSVPIRAALRLISPDEYLLATRPGYGVARMVEANVPLGESVMSMTGVPDAYTTREVMASAFSARGELLADILNMGWDTSAQPRKALTFRFPARTMRRVRVTQVATPRRTHPGHLPQQWSVHEMRVYHGGLEIGRGQNWRLRAWPSPWDVPLAFDNSPATRWRSWEEPSPGMFLEIDFGQEQIVDQVRLETESGQMEVELRIESVNAAGMWEGIPTQVETAAMEPPEQIRRMSTYELVQRGIHYLLIYDRDFGADDINGDPEGWGLTLVAKGYGARLYRTVW